MKCPKCGYNSFEFMDQCKKCNGDLIAFKQSCGIRSVFLPNIVKPRESAVIGSNVMDTLQPATQLDEPVEDQPFSWGDVPADAGKDTTVPPSGVDEGESGFSFGDVAGEQETNFGDLLETDPALEKSSGSVKPAVNATAAGLDILPGDFEMEDFFGEQEKKDASPAVPVQVKKEQEGLDGDFDFLFGDDEQNK